MDNMELCGLFEQDKFELHGSFLRWKEAGQEKSNKKYQESIRDSKKRLRKGSRKDSREHVFGQR